MPVYKDEDRGTWFVKLTYIDFNGRSRQKMKRGFQLRRDAQQWEREFLEQVAGSPEIAFSALTAAYLEDLRAHRKESTYRAVKSVVDYHLLPVFGDTPLIDITPAKYRAWQTSLVKSDLAESSRFRIDGIMRTILKYGVKYYGLSKSPAFGTGRAGKNKTREMKFYTLEQFAKFLETFDREDPYRVVFLVLFYTGIRVGELLAITPAAIDLNSKTLNIINNWSIPVHVMTTPKTEKSKRSIALPAFLCDELRQYMGRFYALEDDTRIFSMAWSTITYQLHKHGERAGLHKIRVHDLRHSHASMLINMGIPPAVIAERLGHESAAITMQIYAHLYPDKQRMVADALDGLQSPGE